MKGILSISLLSILFILLQSAGCHKVKELDYLGIKKSQIQSIGLKNSALRVELEYYNPNKFGLDVKEANLNIYLNDKFVAIADQPEKIKILKEANFIFPVVAHFDLLKVLGSAFSSLFSKTVKVTIKGTAKLGKEGIFIKVPINITENIKLLSE